MLNKSDRVLKERLQNRKEWVEYFSECLLHHNINDKVTNEFYKERPLLSLIFMIYFLPINLIKYPLMFLLIFQWIIIVMVSY